MDSDTGQDENDSEFLEGLRDLGLIDEDDFEKESAKSTPKPAKSSTEKTPRPKSKTRRRQPARRPAINLDDLLDGIDIPKDDPEPVSTPVSSTKTQLPTYDLSFSQSTTGRDYSVRIESSIRDYISVQLKGLRDDFLVELERLLVDNDSIDSTVSAFIGEMKNTLAEILTIELSEIAGKNSRILSAVESVLPGFRDPIKAGVSGGGQEKVAELESLGLAQAAVASFIPAMNNNMKSMNDDAGRDIDELRIAQGALKKALARNAQYKKSFRKSEMELECTKVRQEIESQTIREMTEVVKSLRRPFKDESDDDIYQDESDESHGAKKLRYALAKLRKQVELSTSEPVAKLRRFLRRFSECRDEANSLRDISAFSHQKYVNSLMEASQASSMIDIPPPVEYPRVSFSGVDHYPSYESEIREDPEQNVAPLISTVRRRLKKIQEQREADLQNSASFLQEVKRQEKARIRESALPLR